MDLPLTKILAQAEPASEAHSCRFLAAGLVCNRSVNRSKQSASVWASTRTAAICASIFPIPATDVSRPPACLAPPQPKDRPACAELHPAAFHALPSHASWGGAAFGESGGRPRTRERSCMWMRTRDSCACTLTSQTTPTHT